MKFDLFLSICQAEVDGYLPSERVMWTQFFGQVRLADQLGFGCAWVAETHLSSEVQKRNPGAVLPDFKGEIGLNTDLLQLAHRVFAQTKKINVGSAIRNILANGGPIAHAEAVRMFLALHGLDLHEERRLELGFASGRFPYSNQPYGIHPRNDVERAAWPVLKGLVFQEATEIFLRFLRGDVFSSKDVRPKILQRAQFRSDQDWEKVVQALQLSSSQNRLPVGGEDVAVPPFWTFDKVGVIPFESRMELLRLTIGAHDLPTIRLANEILPVGVFNLSITPADVIEETHRQMKTIYHSAGGAWTRSLMPRTSLVFVDTDSARAQALADRSLRAYWTAMEGTLDPKKVEQAMGNALIGTPEQVTDQVRERFDAHDRLMLWFDFNNHDGESVQRGMRLFMEKVAPHFA